MTTPNEILVFSRWEDGGHPVLLDRTRRHFTVWEGDAPKTFPSGRRLLSYLTGHPTGRNWTVSRYFRLGRYAVQTLVPSVGVLQICQGPPGSVPVDTRPVGPAVRPSRPLGIDLSRYAKDVERILYAGFLDRLRRFGYDPEDVLQEVYRGILVRNRGKCPFDPKKSSFGHYVYMVCSCIVNNYARKQTRRREGESPGTVVCRDGRVRTMDIREADGMGLLGTEPPPETHAAVVEDFSRHFRAWAQGQRLPQERVNFTLKVLIGIHLGRSQKEIAASLATTPGRVARAMQLLREAALTWPKG